MPSAVTRTSKLPKFGTKRKSSPTIQCDTSIVNTVWPMNCWCLLANISLHDQTDRQTQASVKQWYPSALPLPRPCQSEYYTVTNPYSLRFFNSLFTNHEPSDTYLPYLSFRASFNLTCVLPSLATWDGSIFRIKLLVFTWSKEWPKRCSPSQKNLLKPRWKVQKPR